MLQCLESADFDDNLASGEPHQGDLFENLRVKQEAAGVGKTPRDKWQGGNAAGGEDVELCMVLNEVVVDVVANLSREGGKW